MIVELENTLEYFLTRLIQNARDFLHGARVLVAMLPPRGQSDPLNCT